MVEIKWGIRDPEGNLYDYSDPYSATESESSDSDSYWSPISTYWSIIRENIFKDLIQDECV